MSVLTLGGVVLNNNLVWGDRWSFAAADKSVKRTLGGNIVVFSAALIAGRPITLEATQDQGWLTTEQVEALYALTHAPGTTYELVVPAIGLATGESHQVQFRHDDPPAFNAVALIPRLVAQPGDWHTATIKLMTV